MEMSQIGGAGKCPAHVLCPGASTPKPARRGEDADHKEPAVVILVENPINRAERAARAFARAQTFSPLRMAQAYAEAYERVHADLLSIR
jgi:hypothetical protein